MSGPSDRDLIDSRVSELPDWLAPMLVKELRQALRTPFFLIAFVCVHVGALIALMIEFRRLTNDQFASGLGATPVLQLFWGMVCVAVVGVLPMRNLGVLHAATRKGDVELVIVSGLSTARIVVGAWLVQCCLTLLVFIALSPYIVFRYFFGGVEVVETTILAVSILGAAFASNALVIGVSGYANVGVRLLLLTLSLLIVVGFGSAGMEFLIESHAINLGEFFHVLIFLYWLVSLILLFSFYTICGLQVGRAHLDVAIGRPGASTRLFVVGILLSPFVLACGSAMTCFLGSGVVLLPMLLWAWKVGEAPVKRRGP